MQIQAIESDMLQRIFEYSFDVISIHEMDGTYLEVSPACENLLGYTQEKLLGMSSYDLFHPQDHEKIFKSYAGIKEPPHIHKIDYRIKHADGHYIWFETTSSLMNESENARVVSFSREITKRKKTEEELGKVLKSSEQLLNIMSYDLRNSFQVLQVFSRMLAEDLEELEEKEIREFSNEIHTSAIKVNELLNNMIVWSRSHKDDLACNPEPLELEDLLEDVVSLYKGKINQKKIIVDLDLPDFSRVYADRRMCESIFRNLISNALKFSFEGGTIIVKYIPRNGRALIKISDKGEGIDPEKAEKLFQDTTKTEMATRGERGTGIGLMLCKDFVGRHGGKIRAESNPGEGSAIIFDLPMNKEGFESIVGGGD